MLRLLASVQSTRAEEFYRATAKNARFVSSCVVVSAESSGERLQLEVSMTEVIGGSPVMLRDTMVLASSTCAAPE